MCVLYAEWIVVNFQIDVNGKCVHFDTFKNACIIKRVILTYVCKINKINIMIANSIVCLAFDLHIIVYSLIMTITKRDKFICWITQSNIMLPCLNYRNELNVNSWSIPIQFFKEHWIWYHIIWFLRVPYQPSIHDPIWTCSTWLIGRIFVMIVIVLRVNCTKIYTVILQICVSVFNMFYSSYPTS